MQAVPAAIDLARYLLACAILTVPGIGLVRLLRSGLASDLATLIAPGLTQALLACVWGFAVLAGIPIAYVVLPLLAILLGLALFGVRSLFFARTPEFGPRLTILLATSLIAPPLVMLPFFGRGLAEYAGSGVLDGWAYATLGQYLWHFPRGTDGGLAPIFQFAAGMGQRRYGATSELGLFSLLFVPGDLAAANGLLRAVAVFAFTSACAAVIEVRGTSGGARRLRLPLASLYILLCGLSGWILDVVWANNYDNSLALVFGPALVALAMRPAALTSTSEAALLGLLVAGSIYTYPELAPMILGPAMLVGAETVWRRRPHGARWLPYLGVALAVAVLLLAPSARDLWLRNLGPAPPPGTGMFFGLLDRSTLLSAWWGLGGERGLYAASVAIPIVAVWLFALTAAGIGRLVRQRELALALAVLAHLAGAIWMLWRAHYDYGAYKMLLLGWWLTALVLVVALDWLIDAAGTARAIAWSAAVATLLIVPIVTGVRAASLLLEPVRPMSDYHIIDRVPALIGDTPLVLLTEDALATHWGAYYLRRAHLLLGSRNGYVAMSHVQGRFTRARPVSPGEIHLVVTNADPSVRAIDTSAWSLAWTGGVFAIWDTGRHGWAAVTSVRDPLVDRGSPRPVFYVHRGTTLDVLASDAGTLTIVGDLFGTPAVSNPPCWHLQIHSAAGQAWDLRARPGPVTFSVRVPPGTSDLSILGTSGDASSPPVNVGIANLATRFRRADAEAMEANASPHYLACEAPAR
jgi:hypothetical protein